MTNFTREQQLANIDLAARLWGERVTPDKVVERLTVWASPHPNMCGTQACFGGHLATWPEFRAMGVRTRKEAGEEDPVMRHGPDMDGVQWPYEVASVLFGDEQLFEPRGGHPAGPSYDNAPDSDDGSISDYELVVNRLAYARGLLLQGEGS